MSADAFAEVSRGANLFTAAQATNQRLQFELAAMDRDRAACNEKINDCLKRGDDLIPVLNEIRDLLLDRSRLLAEYSSNSSECAALCRQSATAVKKLAR
jgi:hypothetical protein